MPDSGADAPTIEVASDEKDRRNDRWVATVSVIGAAAVALASVLGSIYTTHQSNANVARQSRDDFLRQQRLPLYAALEGAVLKFDPLAVGCEVLTLGSATPLRATTNARSAALNAAQAELRKAVGAVLLVGSAEVRDAAEALQQASGSTNVSCLLEGLALSSGQRGSANEEKTRESLASSVKDFRAKAARFLVEARADVER